MISIVCIYSSKRRGPERDHQQRTMEVRGLTLLKRERIYQLWLVFGHLFFGKRKINNNN
jgi:hypothetical protein